MTALGQILYSQEMDTRSVNSETDGAVVTISMSVDALVRKWTATQISTINISGTQKAGQLMILLITNDATLGRVMTFGTGFKSIGVLTGTTSKAATVMFISDGTNFYELCRSLAL